jgi:hypothetical protein
MWHNPLIQRYRASHLRGNSIIVYLSVYAVAITLALMSCCAMVPQNQPEALAAILTSFFACLVVIQVLLLWGWGTHNCAQVIQQEHDRKSHDFFRLLPLSASEKAIGILIGRNQPVLLLAAINSILMLLVTPNHLLHGQIQCIVWSVAAALSSLSLLSSCAPKGNSRRARSGGIAFVILTALLVPWFLSLANWMSPSIDHDSPLSSPVAFGSWHLPLFIAIVLVVLNLAAWFYVGILRCFTQEELPLFSRAGALGFMANLFVIALLFLTPQLGTSHASHWQCFGGLLCTGLVISSLVLRGSLLLDEHYLEACRRTGDSTPKIALRHMARLSNLGTAAMLLGIQYIALFSLAGSGESMPVGDMLNAGIGLTVIFVFIALLQELHALHKKSRRHIVLIVASAGVLYAVLPLILTGLLNDKASHLFGISYLFECLAHSSAPAGRTIAMLAMHAALFTALGITIRRRYRQLAVTAATMT